MVAKRKDALTGRNEELAARREAVLVAAGAVFFEHGFEAATTLEIARRARTSKRALYELFGSKDELLAALIRESAQDMRAPLELASPDSRAALLETLGQFGQRLLEELFHPHRTAMYRLAIADAFRSGKVAKELDVTGRQPTAEALSRYLALAARNGLLRAQDIELVAAAFFGSLVGPIQMRLLLGLEQTVPPKAIRQRVERAVEVVRRLLA
jgi:AcrR family transcriptional regulator